MLLNQLEFSNLIYFYLYKVQRINLTWNIFYLILTTSVTISNIEHLASAIRTSVLGPRVGTFSPSALLSWTGSSRQQTGTPGAPLCPSSGNWIITKVSILKLCWKCDILPWRSSLKILVSIQSRKACIHGFICVKHFKISKSLYSPDFCWGNYYEMRTAFGM